MHKPESVEENKNIFEYITQPTAEPNAVVVKAKKIYLILNFDVLVYHRIKLKENEKLDKY